MATDANKIVCWTVFDGKEMLMYDKNNAFIKHSIITLVSGLKCSIPPKAASVVTNITKS